jgi:dynein heavy chain
LNAFVVIFLRGIDLVSQAKEDDAPKKKMGALARLRAAAKKVLMTQRFNWNQDLLGDEPTGEPMELDEIQRRTEEARGKGLSDEELIKRCGVLIESIQGTVFNYVRRGLFEKDKLTIATLLALKVLSRMGELPQKGVDFLVMARASTDPGSMGPLSEWCPENLWAKIKGLEDLKDVFPLFASLGEDMQSDAEEWNAWFDDEAPETRPCPGKYRDLSPFERLCVLRAMRQDRLQSALNSFIGERLGDKYVNQAAFSMEATLNEASAATPIFFVLFPGVDPTPMVEALGDKQGYKESNGKFLNISMGQGQEAPAEAAMEKFAKEGGWIMLQNVHLMQAWLPRLERKLEICSETAHADFRCFISAEPPPLSYMKNIPESLLQSCIKCANEAPQDLKSNLRYAWANFPQARLDSCSRPKEFKGCLFTLCFFHALVLGRRRFGQQGWSRAYSFNTGDLTISANIIESYINAAPAPATGEDNVPWEDLRYIIGEIMYGGHITDPWDRRTNATYLEELLQPAIFKGGELAKGFCAPDVEAADSSALAAYIEEKLPHEAPVLFGLHSNSEIGYLSNFSDSIFDTILLLEGSGSGGDGGGGGGSGVQDTLAVLLEKLPDTFSMIDIGMLAEPLLKEEAAPYIVVALQECRRMNTLLIEIRRSLVELQKGLNGQLNMSEPMEDLASALSINQVPGRNPFHKCSWEKLAWWSKKSLMGWFNDLCKRVSQLELWSSDLVLPYSLWLPGLFNPTSYLTAVMQVTARKEHYALDNMTIETHMTTFLSPDGVRHYPADGAFVHGLFIEGARWAFEDKEETKLPVHKVGDVDCAGELADSHLKELLPAMPVVYIRAVVVDKSWIPSSVGYLRNDPKTYECPVYVTTFRGPTYVFLATLATDDKKAPVNKWVLAGVALIMQEDD